MTTTKAFVISKQAVKEAYRKVRAKRGSAGVDGESISDFETNLSGNLYKLWNRMSSGSYFPPPVRVVEIPKATGEVRPLGIPTVSDRIAQAVVKGHLEPRVEPKFHEHSYGYRPGKSAHQAVEQARQQCWRKAWCIDLDIKGFFDNIDHELMMRALRVHTREKWVLLYVERWLKAPAQHNGKLVERSRGTPQGGVISPLLANIFLHHTFDAWMKRMFPLVPFERYADDILIHCDTQQQAEDVLLAVQERLRECRLETHPEKTCIVYCQQANRTEHYLNVSFDFLGFTFRPRQVKTRTGRYSVSFSPAISTRAGKHIRRTIKRWRFHRWTSASLEDIATQYNAIIRGWLNYYSKFHPSKLVYSIRQFECYLIRWVCAKYKLRLCAAAIWLRRASRTRPKLFAHWDAGIRYTL